MNLIAPLILSLVACSGDDTLPAASMPTAEADRGSAARQQTTRESARSIYAQEVHDSLPHAVEVFRCEFDESVDRNYDGWPDGWVRRRGREFPSFLKIGIQPESDGTKTPVAGERYLQMELSGGSAGIVSPTYPLGARGSFLFEGQVRTQQLKQDQAYLTLTFYDDQGQPLETYESNRVTEAPQWQKLRVGPVLPKNDAATHARVALLVAPKAEREDLQGTVQWTNLRLLRLPRIALRASGDVQVYESLTAPEVTCEVSGLVGARPELRFELLNHLDQVVATDMLPLQLEGKARTAKAAKTPVEPAASAAPQAGLTGSAKWKPPIPDYGYYRVRVSMQQAAADHAAELPSASTTILNRSLSLAVLRPLSRVAGGEFGWSIPNGEDPLPLHSLATLLNQAGIGWAKYPVWFSEKEQAQADRLAWFAERLSIHGIEMVGVLDQPPAPLRESFRDKGRLPAASVFQEPQLWQPAVDPVMTRLSLKVRWWQLGDDRDTSYVDFPDLQERVQGVKTHLERFGQQVHLGFGWRWLRELPPSKGTPPWEFLSYSAEPDLTAEELAAYLPRKLIVPTTVDPNNGKTKLAATTVSFDPNAPADKGSTVLPPSSSALLPRAWVVMSPLPKSQYSTATRTIDLVQRMLSARQHGASGVFVPEPFGDEQGLMNADGSPGELFVPWRTTATLLGGSQYLGQLQMPGGSINHLFARDGQTVMVIWNDQPGTETFYLGDEVRQLDVWGRELKVEKQASQEQNQDQPETRIQVGPEPTFLIGLDDGLARWQIRARFMTTHLESVFGRQQPISIRLENGFPQGVSGEATLHAPKAWNIAPQPLTFRLSEGEAIQPEWLVSLQPDAASGLQRLRIDFNITADRNYRFSVYRSLQLGLDDVTVEMRTRVREDGLLLVEQHLTNLTGKPISFQCLLFPPNRRRETKQLLNLPAGRHTVVFLIPNGESLLGQTLWLRAEEIGGPRVLNSTVVVER
jgi:hypothetical protein